MSQTFHFDVSKPSCYIGTHPPKFLSAHLTQTRKAVFLIDRKIEIDRNRYLMAHKLNNFLESTDHATSFKKLHKNLSMQCVHVSP